MRCLKSIKTFETGEMAVLTEAQPVHQGNWLFFFTQHSLDHIYNTVSSVGIPMQLINPSEFSRGPPRQPELDHLPCGERLRDGGCSSLQRGWLWGHLTAPPQCLQGGYQGDRARLFTAVSVERKRDNGHKLRQQMFRLHMTSNVFTMKTAWQWHRLPREAVRSPSVELFRTQVDKALSSHVWPQIWLYCEHESDKRSPEVHSHLSLRKGCWEICKSIWTFMGLGKPIWD